jgi:CRP-like cAMP-binding protein
MAERGSPSLKNLLLASLHDGELQRLNGDLEPIDGRLGDFVGREYEPAEWAYFPEGSVMSMIRILEDGSMIEVGVVGFDGVVGIQALPENAQQPYRVIVQHPGAALRMPMRRLREEFRRGGKFQEVLLTFSTNLLLQVSQTAACNRLHPLEQRLARWLLMMLDRTDSDQLKLTQEFLSHMLGTRIAGVNEAVASLTLSGLVKHGRGNIEVIDREGLQLVACECYAFVKNLATPRPQAH